MIEHLKVENRNLRGKLPRRITETASEQSRPLKLGKKLEFNRAKPRVSPSPVIQILVTASTACGHLAGACRGEPGIPQERWESLVRMDVMEEALGR